MKDKINMTFVVAGHALAMSVDPEERERLEEAVADVDVAWQSWSQRFKGRQKSEILAMMTLLFAESAVALREENQRLESVLADFEERLDNILLLADGSTKKG